MWETEKRMETIQRKETFLNESEGERKKETDRMNGGKEKERRTKREGKRQKEIEKGKL